MKYLYGIAIGFFVGVIVTVATHPEFNKKVSETPHSVQTAPERVIMSIRELQTALNEKGHSRYKCDIDGKIGKETLRAWNNYICDRYAKKEFDNPKK